MNLTHCLISFGAGFLLAILLWIRAFQRARALNQRYAASANLIDRENRELKAKCDKLEAALIRRDQQLRQQTGKASTIEALIYRQPLTTKKGFSNEGN